MKKKVLYCILISLFSFAQFSYGQSYLEPMAVYICNKDQYSLNEIYFTELQRSSRIYSDMQFNIYEIRKLSKAQENMIFNTLDQYDYKSGEIYRVSNYVDKFEAQYFVVEIISRDNIYWKGFRIITY